MATRPSNFPLWATGNSTGRVQPSTAQISAGFSAGEPPVAELENFRANLIGQWLQYLDGKAASTVLASSLDFSTRLIGGNVWSLSGTTLAWDGTFNIAIPSTADSSNAVAAGSVALPSGSIAYVNANFPFSTIATTTNGSPTLTNVVYGDMVAVGQTASGAGIPTGSKVTAVSADGQAITLSLAPTASASNVTVTFTSSGTLTVQTATSSAFVPGPNTVVVARALTSTVIVGVGAGQMVLRQGEQKRLLAGGYQSITSTAAGANATLLAFSPVYISPGTIDGNRAAGRAYLLDASAASNAIRSQFAGFVATNVATNSAADVIHSGILGGFSGLTPGAMYYAIGASGQLSAAKPVNAGEWIVPVGVAASATQLLVMAGQPTQQVPSYKSLLNTGSFFYSASGTSSYQGQTGFVGGNTLVSGQNGFAPYSWTAPFAGSMVGLSFDFSPTSQFSSGRVQVIKSGTVVVDTAAQTSSRYQTNYVKGTYSFVAGDVLSTNAIAITQGPNIQCAGSITLVIELTP